jgi:hypothetical protein
MFPLKGFKIDIGLVHMAFIVDDPQVHENQVSNSRSDEHIIKIIYYQFDPFLCILKRQKLPPVYS